jgi:dTDP-4-dehydrorhamnose 3,5-epimerase
VLEPRRFADERGFFCETYRLKWHDSAEERGTPSAVAHPAAGEERGDAAVAIPPEDRFIQDNHSRSTRGVVRGMHFHVGPGVAKLVRCARGRILDVVVDLRRGSPTYARWEGVELDDEAMRELYVPVGFAHGFCVLSDVADVLYKQTAYYDPSVERGIAWNDPSVGVVWPSEVEPIVSARDAAAPLLSEIADELPFVYRG